MTNQQASHSFGLLGAHYTVILNVGSDISATRIHGRKGTSEQRTMQLVILLKD